MPIRRLLLAPFALAWLGLSLGGATAATEPLALARAGAEAPAAFAREVERAADRRPGGAAEHWQVELAGPDLWQRLHEAYGADAEAEPGPPRGLAARQAARGLAPSELQRMAAELSRSQDTSAAAVLAAGGQVVSRYQLAANALLVRADRQSAAAIARLPQVVAVHRAALMRPQLDRVRQHVGAVRAAQALGLDGSGSLVAILDTGIDYTHAALGGPGTREAYQANDPNRVEPGSFPTAKVVGGVDLAGSRYAADCPLFPPPALRCSLRPSPDADPLDEVYADGMPGQGHGTHTASIAAGLGTAPAEGPGLSPGIAPGADLLAIKIFGAPRSSDLSYVVGQTALLLDGLEWALAHELGLDVAGTPATLPDGSRRPIDVLSLSLGSAWGAGLGLSEQATRRLTELGVTVVASAGNDGDTPYVLGAPAAAASVLAVAASHAPGERQSRLRASWGGRELALDAVEAEAKLATPLNALGPVAGQLAWYGEACDGSGGQPSPPQQPVTGRLALIQRGDCLFVEKLANAEELGAIGAIVYTVGGAPVRSMEGICPVERQPCFSIPAVMIDEDPGRDLRVAALGPEPVTASLDLEPIDGIGDRILASSSRGPSRREALLKPQLTAPGASVRAAWAGSGAGGLAISGSSQAAPAVAGAAAILGQRARSQGLALAALDRAALLATRGHPVIHAGGGPPAPLVPVARQGGGLVDAAAAAEAELLVRSDRGIAELGFGNLHLASGARFETRRLELQSLAERELRIATETRFLFEDDQDAGLSLRYEPDRLTLAPGGRATVSVTLAVDPNALRPWTLTGPGRSRLLANPDFDRFEIDGYVELQEQDAQGQPLPGEPAARLPFRALPHRHSCIAATDGTTELQLGPGAEAEIVLRNDCVEPGGSAAYQRVASDAAEPAIPAGLDLLQIGLRHFELPPNVIDPRHPELRLQVVELAIATRGPRRTPLDGRFRVYFDTDRDGQWDRVGQVEAFEGPRFGSFVTAVDPGSLEPDWVALPRNPATGAIRFFVSDLPYDLDERVSVLRFFANHPDYGIGVDLSGGEAAFDFAVELADALGDSPLSETFPGFDRAPDDLERGGRYAFRQAVIDCLRVDCPSCAEPIDGSRGELIELRPLGGEARLRLRSCRQPGEDDGPTLLLHHATNLAEEALEPIRLRRGWPALLLPWLHGRVAGDAPSLGRAP